MRRGGQLKKPPCIYVVSILVKIVKISHFWCVKIFAKFFFWQISNLDIYPRKAEYQRISFITYTANYQTLGWHWSHQIHPLKRWFKFASKVLIFVIFILLYISIYCTLKWCRWIHIREGDESPNLVWESSRAQLIRLVARNMLILADFVQTTIRI